MTASEADRTDLNRASYRQIAGLYARRQQASGGRSPFGPLESAFLELLGDGGAGPRVADLGCGPAADGARLAAAGCQVVGLDLSAEMLAQASHSLAGRLAQADLRALPLRPGCLDGIWCMASLLHVPESATSAVLAGFRSALREGGALALVTAVGAGSRIEPVSYAPAVDRWFVYRDPDVLRRQLASAGFDLQREWRAADNRDWWVVLGRAGRSGGSR